MSIEYINKFLIQKGGEVTNEEIAEAAGGEWRIKDRSIGTELIDSSIFAVTDVSSSFTILNLNGATRILNDQNATSAYKITMGHLEYFWGTAQMMDVPADVTDGPLQFQTDSGLNDILISGFVGRLGPLKSGSSITGDLSLFHTALGNRGHIGYRNGTETTDVMTTDVDSNTSIELSFLYIKG